MQQPHTQTTSVTTDLMLEIVASIIGVAGAGFRLSLILNAVNCEIANAPAEILTISKNVTLFSLLLKQTAAVLDQPDAVHSPEAVRVAEQILEESNAVFNEINTMLDRVRTKKQDGSVSPSIPQRIKFCFKKHGIEYLLGRMDRLQVSLSLMLQIIQLGSTMAATSRHDPPERVREMSDKIRRERVEAQNVVVLYLFENQHLDNLYHVAREEESAVQQSSLEFPREENDALTLVSTNDSQLTKVEEVVINSICDTAIQPPKNVLPEFGDNWTRMADSKEDMVRVSEQVIDRLLEQWTRWREARDQGPRNSRSKQHGRHRAAVDDVYDDQEHSPFFDRFQDKEDSPNARLLEGPTTDWRQPHSTSARVEKRRRQRRYAGYQPSVSAASSEVEDSPSSAGSKKRPSNRHIIDSDQESSQSENDQAEERPPPKPSHPRRRSSAVMVPGGDKPWAPEGPPMSKSFNASSSYQPLRPGSSSGRQTVPQAWPQHHQQQPQPSQQPPQQQHQPLLPPYQPSHPRGQQRPLPMPDQNGHGHTISAPMLNLQTGYNGGHPPTYPSGMQSPTSYLPPNQQMYPFPAPQPQTPGPPPRYAPPRLSPQSSQLSPGQQRPKSRDGRPHRSPSRLSREYQREPEYRYRHEEEEEKRRKREKRSKFSDGAVKGLLAGGGLAVFLEALDALDI